MRGSCICDAILSQYLLLRLQARLASRANVPNGHQLRTFFIVEDRQGLNLSGELKSISEGTCTCHVLPGSVGSRNMADNDVPCH